MIHRAVPSFWRAYGALEPGVRDLADKSFKLLKVDPKHPSLHFKKVRRFWSVRVGLHHRGIAVEVEGGMLWFWIGSHAEYDRLVS